MQRFGYPWIWILDEDAEFRTLIAGFAAYFHFQTFDFSDFAEAQSGFLFYKDYIRKFPALHSLCGVIATSNPAQVEQMSQWFLEIKQAFPDVKTVDLREARPKTVVEIFELLERFK